MVKARTRGNSGESSYTRVRGRFITLERGRQRPNRWKALSSAVELGLAILEASEPRRRLSDRGGLGRGSSTTRSVVAGS